jgi:cell division septal protein FtsQ
MFRRRPRNRRRKRPDYILAVKVRSDYQARERTRKGAVFLIVAAVLGMIAFSAYRLTQFSTRKFFQENPNFAIRDIHVQTDGHLPREQVVKYTGIHLGQNVFSVDLQEVKRDLELEPLIESAEVRRELPGRIWINVTERVPLAQICVQPFGSERKSQPDPITFYADRHGVVMPAFKLQSPKPLPALTGVRVSDLRVGKPLQSPQVLAALQLLKELELSTVGARLEPERVDLSRADVLVVVTRKGETISFDPEKISIGLRRLGVIMADAQRSQMDLRTVDLTVQQHIPVTFREVEKAN